MAMAMCDSGDGTKTNTGTQEHTRKTIANAYVGRVALALDAEVSDIHVEAVVHEQHVH